MAASAPLRLAGEVVAVAAEVLARVLLRPRTAATAVCFVFDVSTSIEAASSSAAAAAAEARVERRARVEAGGEGGGLNALFLAIGVEVAHVLEGQRERDIWGRRARYFLMNESASNGSERENKRMAATECAAVLLSSSPHTSAISQAATSGINPSPPTLTHTHTRSLESDRWHHGDLQVARRGVRLRTKRGWS